MEIIITSRMSVRTRRRHDNKKGIKNFFTALHQVFRFNIKNSTESADLTLGEAFKPGRLTNQFCKPTSVASLDNGDFFVADGYCNSRIIKYSFSGKKLMEVKVNYSLKIN